MNRVNKYRVWDLRTKNWIAYNDSAWEDKDNGRKLKFDEFYLCGNMVYWNEWQDSSFTQEGQIGKDVITQQFTGLTDKNGKEIYEGDIVQYKSRTITYNFLISFGPFSNEDYSGNGFFEQLINGSHLSEGRSFDNGDCKVIGNIFENKNLIK